MIDKVFARIELIFSFRVLSSADVLREMLAPLRYWLKRYPSLRPPSEKFVKKIWA